MPRRFHCANAQSNMTPQQDNRAAQRLLPLQPPVVLYPPRALVGLTLLLLATWVVFWPALSGSILWDDDANITRPPLQSLNGLYRIWFDPSASSHAQYYPLVHTAFWLEHKVWGDSMLGYHLITLIWHSLCVVLVFLIVDKLKIPGALLAAAIFALHPVMVESVAWVTEQKNTLSAVFYLAAMLSYFVFDQSRQRKVYLGTFGLYALALLSKTAIVTLPASLLVIFWWRRGTLSWRRDVVPLIPFFVLGFGLSLMTMYVEWKLIGAEGSEFELSFIQRFLLSGRTVWFYLGKLFWPARLSLMYPRWVIDPSQLWQWIFSATAIATTIILWLFRRWTRAPLAAWLFFCFTLFPVMGFLNVYLFKYTFVSDHFQYVASLGIIVLVAGSTATASARYSRFQNVGVASCILLLGTLAAFSWRQTGVYRDALIHYQSILAINPDSWMAHTNLALALFRNGDRKEAFDHMQCALRIKPGSAEIHNNLATLYIQTGRAQESAHETASALAINPDFPPAYNNLGVALMRLNRFTEAIEPLKRAITLAPDYANAHANLGAALAHTGNNSEAIDQLARAIELDPTQVDALNDLGLLLISAGQIEEAKLLFVEAIRLQPNRADIHNNLASALKDSGSIGSAIEHYQTAIHLEPDYVEGYFNLSQALAAAGRRDEAINAARRAIILASAARNESAAKRMNDWLTSYRAKP
jgi:tetratricopeptide (TPR) repeat protein